MHLENECMALMSERVGNVPGRRALDHGLVLLHLYRMGWQWAIAWWHHAVSRVYTTNTYYITRAGHGYRILAWGRGLITRI